MRLPTAADAGRAQDFDGLTVDVHRAHAALRDAAAVLRAGQPEVVAQHPEQRRFRLHIHCVRLTVDVERDLHGMRPARLECRKWRRVDTSAPDARAKSRQARMSDVLTHRSAISIAA